MSGELALSKHTTDGRNNRVQSLWSDKSVLREEPEDVCSVSAQYNSHVEIGWMMFIKGHKEVKVWGFCPYGCGQTLIVRSDTGIIKCQKDDCPNAASVTALLIRAIPEHIVNFKDGGFSLKHPLKERVDDNLFECSIHLNIAANADPGLRGNYRTTDGVNFREDDESN